MSAGATPATLRLSSMTPALSAIWPAVPVSISTSFAPVLTSSAVKLIGKHARRQERRGKRRVHLSPPALRMNLSSIGRYQMPS